MIPPLFILGLLAGQTATRNVKFWPSNYLGICRLALAPDRISVHGSATLITSSPRVTMDEVLTEPPDQVLCSRQAKELTAPCSLLFLSIVLLIPVIIAEKVC
ncbi:hypothetical protein B0T25DRAFT_66908 [Lasiosphaeria hispida]|uniref:Uncharacterized protein n=1 Tax=Lasiosphaeria hispida TaxID=260671 RepID=A0AAJ0ML42_9PEZI|nr:hypothetical protein B0T25DRAFT_66908 [Lasiosphaeria hispida]